MEELKEKFNALSEKEKVEFVKEIMPSICQLFSENPRQLMEEMMPMCQNLMKQQGMEMCNMMDMMKMMGMDEDEK